MEEQGKGNHSLRPPLRPDLPNTYCAGKCGKRLLDWCMFCKKCAPDGWDERNRDPKIVADWMKQVKKGSVVKLGRLR